MPEGLPSHTLASVLSRIHAGAIHGDAELARTLDVAFGKHEPQLHRLRARELRGAPGVLGKLGDADRDAIVDEAANRVLDAWEREVIVRILEERTIGPSLLNPHRP